MNNQKRILSILLLCFALSLVYAWFMSPRQKTVDTKPPGMSPVSHRYPAAAPQTAAIMPKAGKPLAFPEPEQAKVVIKHNLFVPLQIIEEKSVAKKAAAIIPPPPPPPPPPPTPQEVARKELAEYKSLGLLNNDGTRVAFLSKNRQIKLVRINDRLINGYKVTSISDNRLFLRSEEGDEISMVLR